MLLDDRDGSAGAKFADADLIGVPTIVVVGKALADGNVEVKDRKSGERRDRSPPDAVVADLAPPRRSPPADRQSGWPGIASSTPHRAAGPRRR